MKGGENKKRKLRIGVATKEVKKMLTHVDKKSGVKTEVLEEQFQKVFGADPENIVKVQESLTGLKKQEQVWLSQMLVLGILARIGRTPVAAEFKASLNTFIPMACFEDSTRKTLTAQAATIAMKASGDYYVKDGMKLAAGESLKASCKVSKDTLYAKWLGMTQVQREQMAQNVIIPWAMTLAGEKKAEVKSKADEVLFVKVDTSVEKKPEEKKPEEKKPEEKKGKKKAE